MIQHNLLHDREILIIKPAGALRSSEIFSISAMNIPTLASSRAITSQRLTNDVPCLPSRSIHSIAANEYGKVAEKIPGSRAIHSTRRGE